MPRLKKRVSKKKADSPWKGFGDFLKDDTDKKPPKAKAVVDKKQTLPPEHFKLAPLPDKKTKLHVIRIPAAEAGTTREEPSWDVATTKVGDQMAIGKMLNWYNYAMDEKNVRKCVEEWIRGTRKPADAEKLVKKLSRVADKYIWWKKTYVSLMRGHMRGFPLSVAHYKQCNDLLDEWFTKETKEEPKEGEPEKKDVVSVQDRIRNQIRPVLGAMDVLSDALLDGNDPKAAQEEVGNLLHNPDFKAPQYRMIGDYLEKNLREWNVALLAKKGDPDPDTEEADMAEGYQLTTLKQLKNAISVFSELNADVRKSGDAVKTPRKKRLRSPEKIVGKLKFKPEDKDLGITSIDPTDLLGASTVFLYNTKRRKLTRLVGEFAGSIDVKRSTIIGANLTASTTKTLRKPDEQLKELLALRKGAGDKWFDKIKAKGRKARARCNIETILLRVD